MTEQEIRTMIEQGIQKNKIMLFIKGTKDMPRCGFSAATIDIFKSLNVEFETMDVLSDPNFRPALQKFSNWPTFPQVFISGKLIGGADITRELYDSGELQEMVG